MKKLSKKAHKKPPTRTCCGCRETFPKKELIRIVKKTDGGVAVDLTGKLNGRGAYICKNQVCLEKAVRSGGIARSLGVDISLDIHDKLREELGSDEA